MSKGGELEILHSGAGTIEDLRKHLEHTHAIYGYIRVPIGAEQRQKFVFLRWVGDKITPMTRAKILQNEATAKKVMKIIHVEIFTSFLDELTVPKLAARLAKAAGANYDKAQNEGNTNVTGSKFNDYKVNVRIKKNI